MVHAVVRRGIEDEFNNPGKFADRFRVYPELVDEANGLHGQYNNGVKTNKGHPCPEKEGASQVPRPGLPQRGRKVILLGGMMNYV